MMVLSYGHVVTGNILVQQRPSSFEHSFSIEDVLHFRSFLLLHNEHQIRFQCLRFKTLLR